eukprot:XP_008666269.1 late secretory pathway protein AVL9-like [Zea mays]
MASSEDSDDSMGLSVAARADCRSIDRAGLGGSDDSEEVEDSSDSEEGSGGEGDSSSDDDDGEGSDEGDGGEGGDSGEDGDDKGDSKGNDKGSDGDDKGDGYGGDVRMKELAVLEVLVVNDCVDRATQSCLLRGRKEREDFGVHLA